MIIVLSTNFAQVSAVQGEDWCTLNYKLNQKKANACGKQNGINDANNATNQVQSNRIKRDLIKSINWKQIMQRTQLASVSITSNKSYVLSIQIKKTYQRNNTTMVCQLLHQSRR